MLRDRLRSPLRDDAPAAGAPLRSQVDDVVSGADDVEVVLDDHHRVPLIDQPAEDVQQLLGVFEVQAGGWLVEDVERAAGAAARQFLRQLHPLRLAARQGRGRLAKRDIAEADRLERAQLDGDGREVLEQRERLIDRQLQHVGDRHAAIGDVECLAVVAPSLALFARYVDVRQEVHLDGHDAVALAPFAPATLDVEREAPRLETALLSLGHHREQVADEREQAGVGGGVRARRSSDRRLVDLDDLVDQRDPLDAVVRAGLVGRAVDGPRERAVEDVVDECRLARAADAGDRGEHAQRKPHVDVLEVVLARPADDDLATGRPARRGRRNRPCPGQVRARDRGRVLHQRRRGPLEDHLPAVLTSAGAEVDHPVGAANGLLVVFDDDHGVAEVAQSRQRVQQLAVVALVQTDRRLVEHVEHTGEVRADLRRQADALPFAARQRGGAASEGEIADADVVQEPHAVLDFAQDPFGDDRLTVGEPQRLERGERVGDRELHVVRDVVPLYPHPEALRPQPPAAAGDAGPHRAVRFELHLFRPGAVLVAAAQVRQQPFELHRRALRRARHHEVAQLLRQLAERQRQVDPEVLVQRLQGLAHQLPVALGPRQDRAVGQRHRFVRHEAVRVEVDVGAEPLAVRARAVRRVEREGARRHLGHADTAIDAGQPAGEQPVALLERVDDDDVLGEFQGGLDRLGQPPLHAAAHDEAIHDHFDRVVAPPVKRDVVLERRELAVDARLGEAAPAQVRQLLLELPLTAADDRRQHVNTGVLRIEHHHVDDALERLAGDFLAAVRAVRDADAREEQTQVVVDFRDGPDGRARVRAGGLLFDRDGGREAVDQVDVWLLHLLEKLAGIRGQRLDVASLPFGVDGVERERRLARTRQAGDDHQLVPRQVDVDVLQVMDTRAANRDPVVRHAASAGKKRDYRNPDSTPAVAAAVRGSAQPAVRFSARRRLCR